MGVRMTKYPNNKVLSAANHKAHARILHLERLLWAIGSTTTDLLVRERIAAEAEGRIKQYGSRQLNKRRKPPAQYNPILGNPNAY